MENAPPKTRPEVLLGERVRSLRNARGWSQEDLAQKMHLLGFTWLQSTAAKTERAARPVRVDEAAALAQLLEVRLDDLVRSQVPPVISRFQVLMGTYEAARGKVAEKQSEVTAKERELADAQGAVESLEPKLATLWLMAEYVMDQTELSEDTIQALVTNFWDDDDWRKILDECEIEDEDLREAAERTAEARYRQDAARGGDDGQHQAPA